MFIVNVNWLNLFFLLDIRVKCWERLLEESFFNMWFICVNVLDSEKFIIINSNMVNIVRIM